MTRVASQAPTQQYSHQTTGSEVDLISGNCIGTSGDLVNKGTPDSSRSSTRVFKLFAKETGTGLTGGTEGVQSALTPNRGSTRTRITTYTNQKAAMSEGAANFLGEFGILVERTWEVQEIRME